jgi:hypothetical protein
MAVDVAKIVEGRKADRARISNNAPDLRTLHEMQLIADSLEAIRGELAGIAHLLGVIAQKPL